MKNKDQALAPVLILPDKSLFPGTILKIPIHREEQIRIIKESLKLGHGLIFSQEKNYLIQRSPFSKIPSHNFYEVATLGRILLLDEQDPLTLKLVVKGVERVLIKNCIQNLPFALYEYESCPDLEYQSDSLLDQKKSNQTIERLANILHHWGDKYILDSLERENFFSDIDDINHLTYYLATYIIRDPELKQILLEAPSLNERIGILDLLLPQGEMEYEDFFAAHALKKYEGIENQYYYTQTN